MQTPALTITTLACFIFLPQARATCQKGCDLSERNTFLGNDALINNTGFDNTAVGDGALKSNEDGNWNTAIGSAALSFNASGIYNTAMGLSALYFNTSGFSNTGIGVLALYKNTTGARNLASGYLSLQSNTTGGYNTALGVQALDENTIGSTNIALGFQAGANLTTGDNNIVIGNLGVTGESNTIRVGTAGTQKATFIAGIRGTPLTQGAAVSVGITADGQLGVRASSARFKDAIKPMDKTSEAILDLKPVTFRYKKELDPKGEPQFGLVAEEVAKVNPDLVVADDQGKPFTVRYEEVNAMLLNEFLKEHKKVEEQAALLKRQEERLERLEALIAGSDRSRQTQ